MNLLVIPFLNLILLFYHLLGDNLGWAIVAITVIINLILFPLNKKSMVMAKKQQHIKPQLDELKKKYQDNKTKLFEEQSKLLKQEGINPAAGCFPALVQIGIIIILIRAFSGVLSGNGDVIYTLNQAAYLPALQIQGEVFNTYFLSFDLTQRDVLGTVAGFTVPGFLVIAAAFVQFISAQMMLPKMSKKNDPTTVTETKVDDLAMDMQKQMVYIFPLLYLWFGTMYPSGLALYFLLSSLFSILRYYTAFGRVRSVN